jgi:uncharacterized protein
LTFNWRLNYIYRTMKLTFLYVTDLHGSIPRYLSVLRFAKENNISLIHLGADILPKGSHMQKTQKKFVKGFLKDFHETCKKQKIDVIGSFGNDDLYSRKSEYKKYAELLDEVPFYKDGYEFRAYGYVPDYPFGLKTACKIDHEGWTCPDFYLSAPVDCGPSGDFVEIPDVEKYFLEKGTIEEDLNKIKFGLAADKTIMSIHVPPWSLDLDVCANNRRVGSKAVYDFIKREQFLLCLSGHLHESYDISRVWKNTIGKTLIIQPGQVMEHTRRVRFVIISISGTDIKPELIEIED